MIYICMFGCTWYTWYHVYHIPLYILIYIYMRIYIGANVVCLAPTPPWRSWYTSNYHGIATAIRAARQLRWAATLAGVTMLMHGSAGSVCALLCARQQDRHVLCYGSFTVAPPVRGRHECWPLTEETTSSYIIPPRSLLLPINHDTQR